MADWSIQKKICATCGSWAGNRTLVNGHYHVRTPGAGGATGECLNRAGKYGIGKLNEQNSCPQYQKWGPLRGF